MPKTNGVCRRNLYEHRCTLESNFITQLGRNPRHLKEKSDGRGRLTSSPPAGKRARSLTLTPPAGAFRALLSFEAPPSSASGAAGTSRTLLMPDGGASDAAGALSDEPSRMYVFMNTGCDIILVVFASMGGGGKQVGGDVK